MTIGDILAVIALIVLIVSSWGALIVFASYIAPQHVAQARARIETSPGWCAARGAAIALATVIFVVASAAGMVGALRLLPFVIAGALFLTSAVGSAAVVGILADRIHPPGRATSCPDIIRTVRATSIYCLAGLFPVGGWFIVAPVALFVTIGSMIGKRLVDSPKNVSLAIPTFDLSSSETASVARS